jgi:hypothetical protein
MAHRARLSMSLAVSPDPKRVGGTTLFYCEAGSVAFGGSRL